MQIVRASDRVVTVGVSKDAQTSLDCLRLFLGVPERFDRSGELVLLSSPYCKLLCLLGAWAGRSGIIPLLSRRFADNWKHLLFILQIVIFKFKLLVLREDDTSGHDLDSKALTLGLHGCMEDWFTEATSNVEESRVVLHCHIVLIKLEWKVLHDSRKSPIRHYHASRILKHSQQRLQSTLVKTSS